MKNPFKYFKTSPEVIRLAVMMYIRYPLSLRQVEDILFERGIDICHETVRYGWNRQAAPTAPKARQFLGKICIRFDDETGKSADDKEDMSEYF